MFAEGTETSHWTWSSIFLRRLEEKLVQMWFMPGMYALLLSLSAFIRCFGDQNLNCTLEKCTRAVRKVSIHCEYLENQSRCLDVTWQPIRGDLTVHPSVGLVGSETLLTELVYCVTVAFTNLLPFNGDFSSGKS